MRTKSNDFFTFTFAIFNTFWGGFLGCRNLRALWVNFICLKKACEKSFDKYHVCTALILFKFFGRNSKQIHPVHMKESVTYKRILDLVKGLVSLLYFYIYVKMILGGVKMSIANKDQTRQRSKICFKYQCTAVNQIQRK